MIAAQDLVESASAFNLTGGALTIRSGYVNKTTNNGYGSSRTFVGGDLTLAAGRGESLDASATKTDGNIYLGHQGASGFEQKMRIDSNGDIRFDGNIGIHASDVYYTNTYEMDSSWTSYQTVTSSLAANAVYLVSINWVHGSSANQPYYYSTSFLWTTCNGTNGTGTDNEKTFLHSTHTGVTSYFMTFRGIATTGSNSKLQLKVNSAWPGINSGNVLNITLNQIMFGTRI